MRVHVAMRLAWAGAPAETSEFLVDLDAAGGEIRGIRMGLSDGRFPPCPAPFAAALRGDPGFLAAVTAAAAERRAAEVISPAPPSDGGAFVDEVVPDP